ncbi:velvet factor-domain-containing protein [Lasiosphaeria miniovina]|uniref:Velvet factor-domain-containing protein n=1 Tax=Lasiosphaeria miniovina TaxID=1954250 RepID=A0AA40A015_9PEZI|nr:velvet factor-domain-containing protein [Lasiosphaeria miniovina]KAK0706817.1 velvet factor-domain-containing protein [Lasiosphaeria miniovina]
MGAPVVAASAHGMSAHESDAKGSSKGPHIVDRITKSGRRLWYCLKVIQQPERARACGSGPKSSADRRPVDPPPVVELRIYEGQSWELAQEKDVTFLYNANFFLYATLEHARVMAHGRVQTPAANTPPVLTGMPVSGMAYLDRPQEAGYFLFPDLSVRHEGRYRLTFNLYEETKEDKDKDAESSEPKQASHALNPATGGSFDFRMEVKSQDFVVYSAKKFPGLTESTALSRVVAEQGCRVRIRRDVRMRRRDVKGGGDFDNGEDEYARRARRTATPDTRPDPYRARSLSGSVERTPYSADSQRRPSIADYPPQFVAQNPPQGGHLQFLGGNSSSQYPSQPQNFAQPPSVPASPVYPPSQGASYPSASSYPPPPPLSYTAERTPSQSYAPITPITPSPRRDSVQHEYRSSVGSATLPPLSLPPYSANPQHMLPQKPQAIPLPPLQIDGALLSRLPMPSPTLSGHRPGSLSGSSSASFSRPSPAHYAGTKRAHDQSFRQDAEPRYDGARDRGLSEDIDGAPLVYKRADGRRAERVGDV